MNAANHDIASPDNSFSYPGKVSLDVAARCNVELYRTFYKQIYAAVLVSALNAILVAGVVWDSVPRVPLIAWGTFIIGLSTVRLLLFTLRRRRAALSDEEAIILRRTAASFFAIGGLAWGVGSVFVILESESIIHHVFMAFVIAGMGAGTMAALTFCLPAFYGFCLPALFMSAAAYFVVGEQPPYRHGGDGSFIRHHADLFRAQRLPLNVQFRSASIRECGTLSTCGGGS